MHKKFAVPEGMPQPALRFSRMSFRALMKATYKGYTLRWAAPFLAKAVNVSPSTVIGWYNGAIAPSPDKWRQVCEFCVRKWMEDGLHAKTEKSATT